MKKITLFLILIFMLPTFKLMQAQSTSNNIQIVVKGTVKDEFTGKPLGVNIQFKTENGSKFKINSNSINGNFEQVFPSGEKVKVVLSGDNIFRSEFDFEVMASQKYSEQKVEWTAKSIKVGAKVMAANLFENGSKELSDGGKSKLDELKNILRFNRNVNVALSISASDVHEQKNQAEPVTKSKKKSKSLPKSAPQPKIDVNGIIDSRLNSLKEYFQSWGTDANRVTLKADYDTEPGSADFNTNVDVVEVRNLFGK